MDLLRFVTAGNVDDGKSTLIGRLLHDSKAIMEDQLEAIQEASTRRGDEYLNLALLTDGLRAEREQGITIDVAYRYFATPKRKFIIADCPGHFQYTRNMVTGASTASLAIVLVDVRRGLQEQTRRHCFVASLLRIPHLVVCVNKMDLVDYSEEAFEKVRAEFNAFSQKLEIHDVSFIPVSALKGDNIVDPSQHMPWYKGRSLMNLLEEVHVASDPNFIDFRMPVQMTLFPQSQTVRDYRGYAGQIASGTIRRGEEILVLPSQFKSRIKSIEAGGKEISEASAPLSVVIRLEDEIDVCRGDVLCRPGNQPKITQEIEATICWMDQAPLQMGRKYIFRTGTMECQAVFKSIDYKFDINSLSRIQESTEIGLNDFARVKIKTSKPIAFDPYRVNRTMGSFILIDEATCATAAGGMILQ